MDSIVRAVDVGSGNTKFVTGVTGAEIRCAIFGAWVDRRRGGDCFCKAGCARIRRQSSNTGQTACIFPGNTAGPFVDCS